MTASTALDLSYADLVEITLTAVTVLLALFAIGIGIFGLWGVGQIRKSAVRTAEKSVREYLNSEDVRSIIETEIRARVADEIDLFAESSRYSEATGADQSAQAVGGK